MAIEGRYWRILGVWLGQVGAFHGSRVALNFDEPVIALYGLNGAGKSTMLQMLELALTGVRPEPESDHEDLEFIESILDVHIRLNRGAGLSLPKSSALVRLITSQALAIQTHEHGFTQRLEDPLQRYVEAHLARSSRRSSGTGSTLDLTWAEALRESAALGALTLSAVGTPDRPSWDVYLAISTAEPAGQLALSEAGDLIDRLGPPDAHWPPRTLPEQGGTPFPRHYWMRVADLLKKPSSERLPQLPVLKIGRLEAERAVYFDLEGHRGGGQRLVRDYTSGFRLAEVVVSPDDTNVDAETLDDLAGMTGTYDGGLLASDDPTNLVDEIKRHKTALEQTATRLASLTSAEPRTLTFDLGHPEQWLRRHPPMWRSNGRGLSSLSYSQQRWASLAVRLAVHRPGAYSETQVSAEQPPYIPLLLLCDEPEMGLHRLLEHRLGNALGQMMRTVRGSAVIATHSPDLLSSPQVLPILVSRRGGSPTLRPIPLSVVDAVSRERSAEQLGLSVGDLWAMTRLTVVVEGVHDEWVFKSLLRDSLDSAVASIYPIHGAARLRSLAEAQLLIAGTDAPILVVLDEMDREHGQRLLESVKTAWAQGEVEACSRALGELRAVKGDTFLFLHQFAHAAVAAGGDAIKRVHVHGLSAPDVICYLPAADLLTLSSPDQSWGEITDEWRSDASPRPATNLKKWLALKGLLPKDPQEVDRRIALAANAWRTESPLPPDLVELGARMLELSLSTGREE